MPSTDIATIVFIFVCNKVHYTPLKKREKERQNKRKCQIASTHEITDWKKIYILYSYNNIHICFFFTTHQWKKTVGEREKQNEGKCQIALTKEWTVWIQNNFEGSVIYYDSYFWDFLKCFQKVGKSNRSKMSVLEMSKEDENRNMIFM